MLSYYERFRRGQYPSDPEPSPLLVDHVEDYPGGRAVDVAIGTGRNACFPAESGYSVEVADQSLSA